MILSMWYWVQFNLFPCPFKVLSGMDCPGCGFQRSLSMLLKGDFGGSFEMYPATIPVILIFISNLVLQAVKFRQLEDINRILLIGTGMLIILSFFYKVSNGI